jgi:hypothetical protein
MGVQAFDFAEIKPDMETNAETAALAEDNAIIGFWRNNSTGEFECYRQFRVDKPIFHTRFKDSCEILNLLHVSKENELFFF